MNIVSARVLNCSEIRYITVTPKGKPSFEKLVVPQKLILEITDDTGVTAEVEIVPSAWNPKDKDGKPIPGAKPECGLNGYLQLATPKTLADRLADLQARREASREIETEVPTPEEIDDAVAY